MRAADYVELVWERWQVVVGGILAGLLVAGAITMFSPRSYASEVTIFVSARSVEGDVGSAVEGNELSAARMTTYAELLTSEKVLREAARRLGPETTAADLDEKVTATVHPETVLLTLTATDSSPDRAARIANLVADRFIENVADLEPTVGSAPAAPLVSAEVFQRATPSAEPVSPRPLFNLVLGIAAGLVLGIGLALLLNALDTTIRSRERLVRAAGAPMLGSVPEDAYLTSTPPGIRKNLSAPVLEDFRRLRASLQATGLGAHPVLLMTAVTPGGGNTTTVCNLAVVTASAGARVLVIDADLRHGGAANYFGVRPATGLTDVLAEQTGWERAVLRVDENLELLGGGSPVPNPGDILNSPRVGELLGGLREAYDHILVDSPPLSLVSDATALAAAADGVVLTVWHGHSSAHQVEAVLAALDAASARCVGTILTRAPGRGKQWRDSYAAYTGTAVEKLAPLQSLPRPKRVSELLSAIPGRLRKPRRTDDVGNRSYRS